MDERSPGRGEPPEGHSGRSDGLTTTGPATVDGHPPAEGPATGRFLTVTHPAYRTTQERIVSQLRQAILSGQLPPGTRLTQNELAGKLEASTSPVREAVRQLAAEGLLRIAPNTRVTVPVPSSEEVADLYELLLLLEPLAMRKAAARITSADLAAAETIAGEMSNAIDDVGRWSMLNCELHNALAAASGSEHLVQALVTLRRVASIYLSAEFREPGRFVHSGAQHLEMIEALRAGDGERAAAVSHRHLLQTLAEHGIASATAAQPSPELERPGRRRRVAATGSNGHRAAGVRRRAEPDASAAADAGEPPAMLVPSSGVPAGDPAGGRSDEVSPARL